MTAARAYLLAGLAAIAVYFGLPWNSFAQTLVYDAIAVSAAAAAVAGARLNRPSLPLPWYLFAAGLLAFAAGDVIFNLYAFVWHADPPVPSVADVFYLAGYPFLTAGLVLLVRSLRREERRGGRIDAAMLIVAFALCQWIFLMQDELHGSVSQSVVALLYPAMDVVLLSALVFFALTPIWRTPSYRYLAASIVLLIFADELYGLSPSTYASTSWLDTAWLLSYVLWGVAALHPSMRELSEPARRGGGPRVSVLRFGMLVAALAAAPVLLLVEAVTGRTIDAVGIAVGAGVLGGLVLLRLVGMIHALDRLRAEERLARAEAESAQRLLIEQNERLREADRSKDEFVALVSHELRTPLTSIGGYLELALEEDLVDEVRGFLGAVSRNTQRLRALVDDLLFVASVQAGELTLDPSEVDLAAVVHEGVLALEPRAAAKRIELTCAVDMSQRVRADRGRILQVLDNLLSNAVKFTPAGGAVHVSLRCDGDRALLEVRDTGAGISEEDQPLVFDRFFRSAAAVERQVPGSGLGLYISRAIAEAHQGSLTVRSQVGLGSTFELELPLAVVAVAESADGLDRHRVRRVRVELAP